MTSHARRLVRNSAAQIEASTPLANLSFATLTIPGSQGELLELSPHLDVIKRKIARGLDYHLKSRGLPREFVMVWELQAERLRVRGEPGWHLHIIFPGRLRRSHAWAIAPGIFRSLWQSACVEAVPALARQNWGGSVDLHPVRRSVARYLGKYISKGSVIEELANCCPDLELPHSWYSVAAAIRKHIGSQMMRGSAVAWAITTRILDGEIICSWLYPLVSPVLRDCDGGAYQIGWVGQLTADAYNDIKKFIRSNPA